jgi:hypothetical protein
MTPTTLVDPTTLTELPPVARETMSPAACSLLAAADEACTVAERPALIR